ncbi:MAG: hypothetical protein E5W59_08630 [Mesorhizobium sp.]|nr:MAG: hypothetical protein E5W59_08630 [Mesorhizobium sp.]
MLSNRWLSAAAGGELEPLLDRGWCSPEAWGRWGRDKVQRILLPNRDLGSRGVVIDLRIMQLADKDGRIPRVEVRVNQTPITTISVVRSMQPEEHRIVIPRLLLRQSGFTTIELRPEASVAASRVTPEDKRLLGVGLIAMRVAPSIQ